MNQELRPAFCSEIILNPNKIFIYKGENYNVDFDLIQRNCKYFYEHRSEFEQKEKIEIAEPIDLPVETFQTFLNCSQNQLTYIDDILGINYLSIKYQNEKLIKFTQDFIEKHNNQLIFQSISLKCQVLQTAKYPLKNAEINIDTSNEEKILSSHFMEYIEDERIFKLPINILDRVMKKYISENKEVFNDENVNEKINNFLLRCLKEYKTPASVLFLNINFNKLDRNLIISLHKDFADIFDFNMINAKSLFDSTYDLISENAKIMSLIKEMSDKQIAQMNEFKEYKMSVEQELKKIREEQTRLIEYRTSDDQNHSQLSSKLQILEENQRNSSKKIQTLENKNTEIEGRFHNIDEKQNNFSGRIQTLEKKISSTEDQLSSQSQNQRSVQSSLNEISEKISKFATREISINI